MRETADFLYEVTGETITIVKYRGEHRQVIIPEKIDGFPVRIIGPEAFAENDGELESVTVPSTVQEICDGAFKFCLGLQELNLSEGLEILGTDLVLVTPISELSVPSTVHTIKNPHELGGLTLHISPKNPYYYSDGYGLYEKHPEGNKILAVDLKGEQTSYRISEGTLTVGRGAFCGEENLEEIWFPESLKIVEEEAFESCRRLKTVHFNDSLEEIGTNAFSYCALTGEVTLPVSLRKLGETVFTNTFDWDRYQDGIRAITVPGENPYFYSDKDGLYRVLPDGTSELLRYFGQDNMWRIPDRVSRIGSHAFRRARIKEITIPDTVKQVGEKVFWENPKLLAMNIEQDETRIYIPRTPVYRKDEVSNLLNREDAPYRFDYQAYDRLWSTYLYVEDLAGMAAFRLRYPRCLTKEQEAFYRSWISEHLMEVMEDLAVREDRERLAELAEIPCFDTSNIDDAIDVLNRHGKTELLGFLMEYRQNHLHVDDFDFTL